MFPRPTDIGINLLQKLKVPKADICKGLQIASITTGAATSVASSGLLSAVTTGAQVIGHIAKAEMDIAYVVNDCSNIPFDEIKEILNEKFQEMGRKLDQNAEALRVVTKLVQETFSAVEKTRKEMQEGFERVVNTIQDTNTKQILSEISTYIEFFNKEKHIINGLNKDDYAARLQEPNSILVKLKETRTSTLYASLFKIIDQELAIPKDIYDSNALRALYALFHGTQTLASIMLYLIEQYTWLGNYHYQKGNLDEFNLNFNQIVIVFTAFKSSLADNRENSSLIDRVIDIVKSVKNKYFIQQLKDDLYQEMIDRAEILNVLKKNITSMNLPIIGDVPENSIEISFKKGKHLNVPILEWRESVKVKYAVQYQSNGNYSRIGDWSESFLIVERANPFVRVGNDKKGRNRIVFRKFNNEKPEMVGILNNSKESFQDIHRDLYNAARIKNKKVAFDIVSKLSKKGAKVEKFEGGKNAIHVATSDGNLKLLKFLISERPSLIDIPDNHGYTPLHIAASKKGTERILRFLIENGAKLNKKTYLEHWTPLHMAAYSSKKKNAEILMQDKRIKVNEKDGNGNTPLHSAIMNDIETALSLLTNKNIDVNSRTAFGLTPLHLAVFRKNIQIAKILLNRGADINAEDNNLMTALHYTATAGDMNMLNFLLSEEGININAISSDGNFTALHFAISTKKEDIAMRLLSDKYINVNIAAEGNRTPLHLAAATGQKNIILKLINKNNVNDITKEKYTPLHLSVFRNDVETMLLLIEKGADVEAQTVNGETSLHLAAILGKTVILENLLNKGANSKAINNNGQMPIHEAVTNGNLKIVMSLIEHDINLLSIRNKNMDYPLSLAIQENYRDIKNYLISRGAELYEDDENPLLLKYAKIGNTHAIEYLIEKEFDYKVKDHEGRDFFQIAVQNGHLELVKYAIETGKVNVTLKNDKGHSALDLAMCDAIKLDKLKIITYLVNSFNKILCDPIVNAALHGHLDIIRYFVEEKGMKRDIDGGDPYKSPTPLCLAIREGHLRVVEYLAKRVSDINAECEVIMNEENAREVVNTPLLSAIKYNRLEILKILIKNGANPLSLVSYRIPLIEATEKGFVDIVKYLLEVEKVDVNSHDNFGRTALHATAWLGDKDMVVYLIHKGADVNKSDDNGNTALRGAIFSNDLSTVRRLIENGARIYKEDSDGLTPLHIVTDISILKYLVEEQKLDVNVKNKDGHTPLYDATKLGETDKAEYLSSLNADSSRTDAKQELLNSKSETREDSNLRDLSKPNIKENMKIDDENSDIRKSVGAEEMKLNEFVADKAVSKTRKVTELRNALYNRMAKSEYRGTNRLLKSPSEVSRRGLNPKRQKNLCKEYFSFASDISTGDGKTLLPGAYYENIGFENSVKTKNNRINSQNVNGTLFLLDVILKKLTNQRYKTFEGGPLPVLEAQSRALNIVEHFAELLDSMTNGTSGEKLDLAEIFSKVFKAVKTGNMNDVLDILCSYLEKIFD